MEFIAKETLYLASDRETLVRAGGSEAAFLLCGCGSPVEPDVVEKHGLLEAGLVEKSGEPIDTERTRRKAYGNPAPEPMSLEDALAMNVSKANSETLAAVCAALGIEPGESNGKTREAIDTERTRRAAEGA